MPVVQIYRQFFISFAGQQFPPVLAIIAADNINFIGFFVPIKIRGNGAVRIMSVRLRAAQGVAVLGRCPSPTRSREPVRNSLGEVVIRNDDVHTIGSLSFAGYVTLRFTEACAMSDWNHVQRPIVHW